MNATVSQENSAQLRQWMKYWFKIEEERATLILNCLQELLEEEEEEDQAPNDFSLDACVDYHGTLNQRQLRHATQILRRAEVMSEAITFDVQKFVKERFIQAMQSVLAVAPSFRIRNFPFWVESNSEFIQSKGSEGKYLIQWTFDIFCFTQKKRYSSSVNVVDLMNVFLLCEMVPKINTLFLEVLARDPNKNIESQYKWVRDQMLYIYFEHQCQTKNLSFREEKAFGQIRNSFKPDKNAYPCLLNWVIQIILHNKLKNQQNEDLITHQAMKLRKQCNHMIQEIGQIIPIPEFKEELKQLRLLQFEDFKTIAKSHNNLHFLLSSLRERLSHSGINKESIVNYHKEYSQKPSFKKIYQLQDEKKIHFWIVVMAIVLKELPLGSFQLKKSSLTYWILQNPNMGLKLKMNLLNLDMRRYYIKEIKEAQMILLGKLGEKNENMKALLQQTLQIIEENHQPAIQDLQKQKEKLKRFPDHDLQEQESIHKVRISEKGTLKKIQTTAINVEIFRKQLMRYKQLNSFGTFILTIIHFYQDFHRFSISLKD